METDPLFGTDIRQGQRRRIEWLQEVNPNHPLSHTSDLELLASLLLDEPRRFSRLSAIQAISETLTDEAQAKSEAAFRAPLKVELELRERLELLPGGKLQSMNCDA